MVLALSLESVQPNCTRPLRDPLRTFVLRKVASTPSSVSCRSNESENNAHIWVAVTARYWKVPWKALLTALITTKAHSTPSSLQGWLRPNIIHAHMHIPCRYLIAIRLEYKHPSRCKGYFRSHYFSATDTFWHVEKPGFSRQKKIHFQKFFFVWCRIIFPGFISYPLPRAIFQWAIDEWGRCTSIVGPAELTRGRYDNALTSKAKLNISSSKALLKLL
jgi:hypothetical protein